MLSRMNVERRGAACFRLVAAAVVVSVLGTGTGFGAEQQEGFSSGQKAVDAFVTALRENNDQALLAIFGADANDLIYSGDEVADKNRRERFVKAYETQHKLDTVGNELVLVIGKEEWPFPIPIVQRGDEFVFDTAAGKEEILNRRIGHNEADTVQVLLAIVDSQREYAMMDYDRDGLLEYAQKFESDPGQKNGLYWKTADGEKPSPLGPLVAQAREQGYTKKESGPTPYHGYYYRMLTSQGPDAEGGACDYVVDGKMIGGFAVVAYPARYGNSGIMTFMVDYEGVVYQKDLGPDTEKAALAIKEFNPDKSWTKAP